MGGKAAIALGLLAGVAVGGLLVGGFVALAPAPGGLSPTASQAPTAVPTEAFTPATSPSPSASSSPSGTATAPAPASPVPSPSASSLAEAFGIGQPAPPLRLPLVGGGTVDIADLRGKPVWVTFMGSYCPPCVDELPLMRGFEARYKDDGLQVLLVDVRERGATARAFLDLLGVSFPTALDRSGDVGREWGAIPLPVHFWVDGDGIVRDAALGGIGPDVMANGLRSILPGVTVTP